MTDKPDLTPSSIKDPPTVSYTTGSGEIILIFAVSLLLFGPRCSDSIHSNARRGVKTY
jgi:hypothetical protein